jgi:peroxiredoxin
MAVKPRETAPDLDLPLAGGGRYRLGQEPPERFTALIFYRGLHCPVCKRYLTAFNAQAGDYAGRGVELVAISVNDKARAEEAKRDWGLDRITVAHDFPVDEAPRWGLYVSNAIREAEPARFNEPGLFLVTPDRKLQFAVIATTPQLRPAPEDVLRTIDFVIERNYPARGEA